MRVRVERGDEIAVDRVEDASKWIDGGGSHRRRARRGGGANRRVGISRGRARLGPIRHQGESQRTGDAHEIETRASVVVNRCVCCYLYVQCREE